MSIRSTTSMDTGGTNILTIYISGRFDISSYREFSQAYKEKTESFAKYVIDMSELEYMDSSALGMLLMLRERAAGETAQIVIVNCSSGIMKILKTVNFDRLFSVN